MNQRLKIIERCLSLRPPQSEALNILAEVAELLPLAKAPNLDDDLAQIAAHYPTVSDFERDFPSLCFALATGVGKTRLMGAFIAYLHLAKGFSNFMVLAPNLTIYNKLITDFRPNTPKYVFAGLSQFSQNPPEIITGDNYEAGQGVREAVLFNDAVHINIFNISKLNSEVRGDAAPRMKRLMETLGQSYFNYLASLPDLVLLMDEAHRYRATAGLKAINELKPVLGLELTATPQIEEGKAATPFKNVIYSYPLHQAMADGFVKEPAVATRENFNATLYTEEELERLKLEDGLRIHETAKTELALYAANGGRPLVKPFMLVVAQDTAHAARLMTLIESPDFCEGRYQGRVITVHSNQRGAERDETIEKLLAVESAAEATEIVIHVNMLKEGWDVTNLYTIVPLRAANSRTLVEQSIGRGLRLPYGKKTGVRALDRLTIVAHDRFDEIIRDASDQKSLIRTGLIIGRDVDEKPTVAVVASSNFDLLLGQGAPSATSDLWARFEKPAPGFESTAQPEVSPALSSAEGQRAVQETLAAIKLIERAESPTTVKALASPDLRRKIIQQVTEKLTPTQGSLGDFKETVPVAAIVDQVTQTFIAQSIDLPRIVVAPEPGRNYGFDPFTLETGGLTRFSPVAEDILIQHLRTAEKEALAGGRPLFLETKNPADHLVVALLDFGDISYDDHAAVLHDLAGQMLAWLKTYLPNDDDFLNVLRFYQKPLAGVIHSQMQKHFRSGATKYTTTVTPGFSRPSPYAFSLGRGETIKYFRHPVPDKSAIKSLAFQGFKKCLYPVQKFDSDPEREFAVLLEDAPRVQKWFKPGRQDLYIFHSAEHLYQPDFVVELDDQKLLCEPKMEKEIESEEVQSKAAAARQWCQAATDYELRNGGKPWSYVLIPHTAIKPSATLEGLIKQFICK